ncbi:hypothetical protein EOM86_13465 [Candidatus Nomurabacteria bacterium]|nr:hypothetical protein [Candidatus Nomurabacteria bacterium]
MMCGSLLFAQKQSSETQLPQTHPRVLTTAREKNKTLMVDTETDATILSMPDEQADPIILDTNKKFRSYLDVVTCFTTKERVKRAKKAAEKEE